MTICIIANDDMIVTMATTDAMHMGPLRPNALFNVFFL